CIPTVISKTARPGSTSASGISMEWTLPSPISYVRVVGGPPSEEVLYAGTQSGTVYTIQLGRRFPVKSVVHSSGINE
ncbi:hypothetical protein KIPB_016491, partial [Kipferlia bialata]